MTSTTVTIVRADIESAGHYRTTYMTAAEAPVYITMETEAEQECSHPSAIDLTRFGYATCSKCHATMWSLRWLATDVYGPGTPAWGADTLRFLQERMIEQGVSVIDTCERLIIEAMKREQAEADDALELTVAEVEQAEQALTREAQVITPLADLLAKHLGPMPTPVAKPPTETVVAMRHPDGAPANTRRPGIPVPHMDLIDVDWTPDQPA